MSGHGLLARGGALRFVHAVNDRARFDRFLADPRIDVFEADVSTSAARGGPIMAHPPITESDLGFEAWFDESLAAGRVVKIDLKDQAARRAVEELLVRRDPPRDRFFLNADFCLGPGGAPPVFTAADAVAWRRRFSEVIISIGCTTGPDRGAYHPEDVDLLLAVADAVGEPATVCLDVHRLETDRTALERIARAGRHISLWNQHAADGALFRRYRALCPDAFIDLFDAARDPIVE